MKQPLIFDIRRFALDDGPGIRTTVFLKGCPLRCKWCHNPESWSPKKEIAFYFDRCIGCGDCMIACPTGAAGMANAGRIDRNVCNACGKCTEACPSRALETIGRRYSVGELFEILMKDRLFYEASGGGVTFSGGEPMVYMDYVGKVMKNLKREGIHVAVQTCGSFDCGSFKKKILPCLDLLFYDIKLIHPETHKKHTGKNNHKILKNFRILSKEKGLQLIARTPEIPAITTSPENLNGIRELLNEADCSDHTFLPFNSSVQTKRLTLGHKFSRKPPGRARKFAKS